MLDQVEQSRLRPMDIVDHDNEWPAGQRGCPEQAAHCPGDLRGLCRHCGKADGPRDHLGDMLCVGLMVVTARGTGCLNEAEDAGSRVVEIIGWGKPRKIL